MIVVCQGEFGAAVAESLSRQTTVEQVLSLDEARQYAWRSSEGRFIALAFNGAFPQGIIALSAQLEQHGLAHSAAVLTDDLLTCGPLILPGRAPCMRCAVMRKASMVDRPRTVKLERDFHGFVEASPHHQLAGFLPGMVEMAALRLLRHSRQQPDDVGRVVAVSLTDSRSVTSRIKALHGCACRQQTFTSLEDRWTTNLRDEMEKLLS